jgi:hypothetical protein
MPGYLLVHHPPDATGSWVDVTPGDMDLETSDTYGCRTVLADPVTPGVLYAFEDESGCWRSTNAGLTWTRRDDGTVLAGNWGGAISPDGSFILSCTGNTSKTVLGTNVGYTVQRSTDGGVTWSMSSVFGGGGIQPYGISILPTNKLHCLASSHDDEALYMSTDGGVTWVDKGDITGIDLSYYVVWIDATTALAISQEATSGGGIRVGTYNSGAGTWGWGSIVSSQMHTHGVWQPFIDGTYVFAPGVDGILRAALSDLTTWTSVEGSLRDCVFGTTTKLYSGRSFPSGPGAGRSPELRDATRPTAGTWSSATNPTNMFNGPGMGAVTTNQAGQQVLVMGCWNAGIWRYVEP